MSIHRRTHQGWLFSKTHPHASCFFALLCLLLVIASCGETSQGSPAHPTIAKHPTPTAKHTPSPPPPTIGSNVTQADINGFNNLPLYALNGPNGWAWRINLPSNRLVLFYGNPFSSAMGPLGQYSDSDLIAKLQEQAQAYSNLDPSHPVAAGLDYVTPVVQPVPEFDGSWVARMPDDSLQHYIDLANSNHMLFFFDMQIGHSTIQKEVGYLWNYLQNPGVELTLDPEFDMPPGTIPDVEFGQMKASEINWVIDQLSNLVMTKHLPPKILIIHQFRESMLPDWQNIRLKPGVSLITCVDGFGPPGSKIGDYQIFDKQQLLQYPGMKLFYVLDKPLMSPSDVLALDPAPLMVMYQ